MHKLEAAYSLLWVCKGTALLYEQKKEQKRVIPKYQTKFSGVNRFNMVMPGHKKIKLKNRSTVCIRRLNVDFVLNAHLYARQVYCDRPLKKNTLQIFSHVQK